MIHKKVSIWEKQLIAAPLSAETDFLGYPPLFRHYGAFPVNHAQGTPVVTQMYTNIQC